MPACRCGRCCPSVRPATATPRMRRSRPSRAIPLLVSLERLVEDGSLEAAEIEPPPGSRRPGRLRQAHSLEARPAGPRRAPLPLHGLRRPARGVRALLRHRSRRGSTTTPCSWRSRRGTTSAPVRRGDPARRRGTPGGTATSRRASAGRSPGGRARKRSRRRGEGGPALVLLAVGRPARARGGARRQDRGRRAHLRGARQRRRVGRAASLPPRPRPPADRGVRGSAGLFQRDRPALGQPDLRLAPDGARGVRVVDPALPRGARRLRRGARGPLPGIRGLLGGAGGRADGGARPVGAGAGPRALRRGAPGAGRACR